jgi:hypothetical protein
MMHTHREWADTQALDTFARDDAPRATPLAPQAPPDARVARTAYHRPSRSRVEPPWWVVPVALVGAALAIFVLGAAAGKALL